MFDPRPGARADLTPGTLYAVTGEHGWIYYGQLTLEHKLGFFRRRDRAIVDPATVLAAPILSVVIVSHPSIRHAMRAGAWRKLGRWPVAPMLVPGRPSVDWPVGTCRVTVCEANGSTWDTRVDDPAIQDMELTAVRDAQDHVPERLTADFGAEPGAWHVGGSIRRERRIREAMAARFPERPEHALPDGWVPAGEG